MIESRRNDTRSFVSEKDILLKIINIVMTTIMTNIKHGQEYVLTQQQITMTLTDAEYALRWATPCGPRDWELNEYAWVGESLTNRPEVEKKTSTIMEKLSKKTVIFQ